MNSVTAVLGVLACVLIVVGLLWLSGLDIVGGVILRYTVEPFTRWFMRVFHGIDKPLIGPGALVGTTGKALSNFAVAETGLYSGRVEVCSEPWSAHSVLPISAGSTIRVVESQGVFLRVEALQSPGHGN